MPLTIADVVDEFQQYYSGDAPGNFCERASRAYKQLLQDKYGPAMEILKGWLSVSSGKVNGWQPTPEDLRHPVTRDDVMKTIHLSNAESSRLQHVRLLQLLEALESGT